MGCNQQNITKHQKKEHCDAAQKADGIDNIISRHKGAPRRLNKTQHLKEFKDMLKNGVTTNMVKHRQFMSRFKNKTLKLSEDNKCLVWGSSKTKIILKDVTLIKRMRRKTNELRLYSESTGDSQQIEVLRNKNNKFNVSEWGTLLTWMVEEFQGPYACTFVQT